MPEVPEAHLYFGTDIPIALFINPKILTILVMALGTVPASERSSTAVTIYSLRHICTSELTYQLRFFINPKILTILVMALGTVPASERSSTTVTIYSLRHSYTLELVQISCAVLNNCRAFQF